MTTNTLEFRMLSAQNVSSMWQAMEDLSSDQSWMAWDRANYVKHLSRKWELSRAAFLNDQLVGYCLASTRGGMLWIHRLVVSKTMRGRQLGAAMIEQMINIAQCASLKGVLLKTPHENKRAISFYAKHGFRPISDTNNYVTLINNFKQDLIVGVHQPNYLPWLGYFYKMAMSNVFIFLDDVEFPKGSYVNRNKLAVNGVGKWLTVPTGREYQALIMASYPAGDAWIAKHLRTLEASYGRAPYFSDYFSEISAILNAQGSCDFARLNIALIEYVASKIGIDCICLRSSQMNVEGKSDARLADLVSAVGGGTYISGSGGSNYQSEQTFTVKGIELTYTDFLAEPYSQKNDTSFIPGLGVLDALFNIGGDAIGEMFIAFKNRQSG